LVNINPNSENTIDFALYFSKYVNLFLTQISYFINNKNENINFHRLDEVKKKEINYPKIFKIPKGIENPNEIKIFEIYHLEIARQLTLIEHNIFKQITPSRFLFSFR
jgi:hypothetical protein